MNIYEVTFSDGTATKSKAWSYIWTGTPGVANVQDLGAAPAAVTSPVVFDGADWREYCYAQLGAIVAPSCTNAEKEAAGLARYGEILKNVRASKVPAVIGAFDQYDNSPAFRKDRVTVFLGVLNSTDPKIVTDAELAAIVGNWTNA